MIKVPTTMRTSSVAVGFIGLTVLLGGCIKSSPPASVPTVIQVACTYARSGVTIGGDYGTAFETYYWSNGTKTYKAVMGCP